MIRKIFRGFLGLFALIVLAWAGTGLYFKLSDAGPWPALITKVNADGTVDLAVDPPAASSVGASLTSPLITDADADGTYGAPEATLINNLKAGMNSIVTRLNQLVVAAGRKASVVQGGQPGQYSLAAGPDSV